MITMEGDYTVGIDIPEVTRDVGVTHGGKEEHVFTDLGLVFGLGGGKLEINHDPLCAVGHHTVWTTIFENTILIGKDCTLVEERPTGREPVGHLRMTEALTQHLGNTLSRNLLVVKHALKLQAL